MILVDTSVWVDHFARGVPALFRLLEVGEVLVHPFVIGELACGNLTNRREILELLASLPPAPSPSHDEALEFVERHALMGRGVGYLDVHLLAATSLAGTARLWTRDRRLAVVAAGLDVNWSEPLDEPD